jgi:DNA-directed RNA polymerase subunit N (RpoN/RPB10)
MIIPVRCFTCNMVLGSKYQRYLEIIKDINIEGDELEEEELEELKSKATVNAFIDLEIRRYCCKRHLLSHIDLVNNI